MRSIRNSVAQTSATGSGVSDGMKRHAVPDGAPLVVRAARLALSNTSVIGRQRQPLDPVCTYRRDRGSTVGRTPPQNRASRAAQLSAPGTSDRVRSDGRANTWNLRLRTNVFASGQVKI